MTDSQLTAYLSENRQRHLDELCDWLRIPSVSTQPKHKEDVAQAAVWLAAKMSAAGLENVEVIPTDRHPLVYGDWLHAGGDAPTVLVYGHYDVQPVDPIELWETPPFQPTVRGESLYARGSSDDKGQTYVHVAAVEALLQTQGKLPVNVKFIVEGEEEDGSKSIMRYVPENTAKLAADLCLISDGPILAPDKPKLVYGLRGIWAGEISVRGPAHDLHSGMYGGAVHNPNQALAELLAALHNPDGSVAIPGFYDDVLPLDQAERDALAKIPYGAAELLVESGVPAPWGEAGYTINERIGARPTLEINGMWGGFIDDGFKTVIPGAAHAKVSCRLVPNQDSSQIGALLDAYLQRIAPPTVQVSVTTRQHAPAVLVPLDTPQLAAAATAYERAFGATPVFSREGGSIGVAITFQTSLKTPLVFLGFGLPDDNLHAPNEKMHLPNFYRGIQASVIFLQEVKRG
jgi:acetylornithine deacetylase/succinyl-diaminopimelate desuccinylase-like protein